MKPGDIVIYLADPLLYGKLLILEDRGEHLLCEQVHADADGEFGRELFGPHELELASRWWPAPVEARDG